MSDQNYYRKKLKHHTYIIKKHATFHNSEFYFIKPIIGDKSVETGTDPLLENKIAIFDETLKLDLTLYFDKKRQKYLEKVLQINVILILEEEEKLAGSIDFDVAHLLNTFGQFFPNIYLS